MKLLITGGTGFIGKSLLKELDFSSKDFNVLALSRSPLFDFSSSNVEWFKCDLLDVTSFKDKIAEFKPEVLIHLAWDGIPDFSFEKCLLNLNASINLVNSVLEIGSIKRVITTGSCFEYNKSIGICSESDECKPKDYFTWSKNTFREYLQIETSKRKIKFGWARLFYVYGPNQREGSLIPTILKDLKESKSPNIRTPLNANDFVYVDDVARGIISMLNEDFISGIYNLGSGNSTPVIKICEMVELELYNQVILSKQLIDRAKNSEKSVDFYADIEKSTEKLKWTPKINLKEGIKLIKL